jgi:hypothetical protein
MRFLGFFDWSLLVVLMLTSKNRNSLIDFLSQSAAAVFALRDSQNSWIKWIDGNNNPLFFLNKKES